MLGYYLGAGASAKSLPVARATASRLKELADTVHSEGCGYGGDKKERVEELVRNMRCLAQRAEAGSSIDALARRCHLRREGEELRRIKKVLSAFFLLEQSRIAVDPRYDEFFSYMVGFDNGRLAMPTNLRVISWNYDIQLEKSFAEFLQDSDLSEAAKGLQVFPGVPREHVCGDLFAIYKLNGTASMEYAEGSGRLYTAYDLYMRSDVVSALENVLRFSEDPPPEALEPYLRFAWEDDLQREEVLDQIVPVDALVVIGYSFPLFNRDVDRQVLNRLEASEVYVQVGDEGVAVKERLGGLGVDRRRIRIVEDLDQFYVPSSYSPSERVSPEGTVGEM